MECLLLHHGFSLWLFPTTSMDSCMVSGSLHPAVSGKNKASRAASRVMPPQRVRGSGIQYFFRTSVVRAKIPPNLSGKRLMLLFYRLSIWMDVVPKHEGRYHISQKPNCKQQSLQGCHQFWNVPGCSAASPNGCASKIGWVHFCHKNVYQRESHWWTEFGHCGQCHLGCPQQFVVEYLGTSDSTTAGNHL